MTRFPNSVCAAGAVVVCLGLCGCAMQITPTQPGAEASPNPTARQARLEIPADRNVAPAQRSLETVATFDGPMPTGVTISRTGRIFVCFPKWGDNVPFTVAEFRNSAARPFPNAEMNRENPAHPEQTLISVQSVVADPADRLWILDTGSINFGPTVSGGPKLVGVDLQTNRVFKTITFPADVALPTTYLNDVRFNFLLGKGGIAFITDSSSTGPNGIIVVDLESGKSWRRLNDHPSVKAAPNFVPLVEGQPLMMRQPGQPPQPMNMGADGIAISPDGNRLYYCPLSSRNLYSVSVPALADPKIPDSGVAATVENLGEKGACDGMECDSQGRLYYGDYERNTLVRRLPDGTMETLVDDARLLWPDTLSLGADGYLYVTVNQLERMARFHEGRDLRQRPYYLYRVQVNAQPQPVRPPAP